MKRSGMQWRNPLARVDEGFLRYALSTGLRSEWKKVKISSGVSTYNSLMNIFGCCVRQRPVLIISVNLTVQEKNELLRCCFLMFQIHMLRE
jgi:hypothetical protein